MSDIGNPTTPQPFRRGVAITPADGTTIMPTPNAIIVGASGNVAFVGQDGVAFTVNGLTAGTIYPIAPSIIKATGTTATGIVALYY
jgi:hypothetical protein